MSLIPAAFRKVPWLEANDRVASKEGEVTSVCRRRSQSEVRKRFLGVTKGFAGDCVPFSQERTVTEQDPNHEHILC